MREITMETKEIIMWVILAITWIRVIWRGVCIKVLAESFKDTRKNLTDWIYDIGKSVEKYGEMPDNLRGYEKKRIEELQAEAKEWGEKNVK